MQKALFLPIRPYYSYHIMIGDKLWEVRTYKLPTDKDIYGYVTKGKPYFYQMFGRYTLSDNKISEFKMLNGTVPFKFRVGEIVEVPFIYDRFQLKNGLGFYDIQPHDLPLKSCLSIDDINAYGKGKTLYFHEITNLHIFDKPMALGEFTTTPICENCVIKKDGENMYYYSKDRPMWHFYFSYLTKAPKSYQYVWVRE